ATTRPDPDAAGAAGKFHVTRDAAFSLDYDPLAVARARRLVTGRLAAHEGRPPPGDALLELRPRGLPRRDYQRAPEAVHQDLRTAGNAGQDARKARDGRDSLLAGQQRRVRALSERFHDHG